MGITRKSLFGFPPAPRQGSEYTQRMVPLTQGVQSDQPWPALPPGSAASMCNFLPIDGALIPRSRLSSLNTLRTLATSSGAILGLAQQDHLDFSGSDLWASGTTLHGIVSSNGSISRASFVSAFGLGLGSLVQHQAWMYSSAYNANTDDNVVLAWGGFPGDGASKDTILALYRASGSFGAPLYSYLTSAPVTGAVGSFDNYVIAGGTVEGVVGFATRVRWCVRGNSSNWTGEGSGFEDLLEMQGNITAIVPLADQRFYVFSDKQIWYGIGAAYPAQFQFACQEKQTGCTFPRTIVDSDFGIIFLGNDSQLRLIPSVGGDSQPFAPSLTPLIKAQLSRTGSTNYTHGVYDPQVRLYYLTIYKTNAATLSVVVNPATGTWGYMDYNSTFFPLASIAFPGFGANQSSLVLAGSSGTVYSTKSTLANDAHTATSASTVTSAWRSTPIASDLPGNWKQLTEVDIDYRAYSRGTLGVNISQDGGNTFESSGRSVTLSTAAMGGRATSQMYVGGAFPAIELTSTSTGYELHRLDIGMTLGGRRSG